MPSPFSITAASTALPLDAQGRGEAVFTVYNSSGMQKRGRALVVAENADSKGWFQIQGSAEREFPVDGTETITVAARVPSEAPAGTYPFRLRMAGVDLTDEEVVDSPTVVVTVAARAQPPKPGIPWWVFLIIGVVVLGAVAFFIFRPRAPEAITVPSVAGLNEDAARDTLRAYGIAVANTVEERPSDTAKGTMLGTRPPAGTSIAADSSVVLIVSSGTALVNVPKVVDLDLLAAQSSLATAGLVIDTTLTQHDAKAALTVLSSNPTEGTPVPKGSGVKLTISTGPSGGIIWWPIRERLREFKIDTSLIGH